MGDGGRGTGGTDRPLTRIDSVAVCKHSQSEVRSRAQKEVDG